MSSMVQKGIAKALAEAWEKSEEHGFGRAAAGPNWEVAVSHDDPWEAGPMGGRVIKVRHYGDCVCLVARGEVVATATSASDRDGVNTVIRLLCPGPWAVSLKGGRPRIVDEDGSRHAHAASQRPAVLDGVASAVSVLAVLPYRTDDASETFADGVSSLMIWQGTFPHVADDGSIVYERRWLSA